LSGRSSQRPILDGGVLASKEGPGHNPGFILPEAAAAGEGAPEVPQGGVGEDQTQPVPTPGPVAHTRPGGRGLWNLEALETETLKRTDVQKQLQCGAFQTNAVSLRAGPDRAPGGHVGTAGMGSRGAGPGLHDRPGPRSPRGPRRWGAARWPAPGPLSPCAAAPPRRAGPWSRPTPQPNPTNRSPGLVLSCAGCHPRSPDPLCVGHWGKPSAAIKPLR